MQSAAGDHARARTTRDLDPPEEALLDGSTMTHVPTDTIPVRLPEALARALLDDAVGYLHLDVDLRIRRWAGPTTCRCRAVCRSSS